MTESKTKKKLTIYIDEEILKKMKILAIEKDISLSELTNDLYKKCLNASK